MELPAIGKDVRCYWQSKSLSSVQVKNSINFFDLSKKRKEIIFEISGITHNHIAPFPFLEREFLFFLLLKYTHKQTESKHKLHK